MTKSQATELKNARAAVTLANKQHQATAELFFASRHELLLLGAKHDINVKNYWEILSKKTKAESFLNALESAYV